jgi:hypothetical protein
MKSPEKNQTILTTSFYNTGADGPQLTTAFIHQKQLMKSDFELYGPLKIQQVYNMKNKFDNRLYFSYRWKNYKSTPYYFEIFGRNRNHKTIFSGIVC